MCQLNPLHIQNKLSICRPYGTVLGVLICSL
nr:MAG TPA: hypothetical protein [Caudoviricetes sp.]